MAWILSCTRVLVRFWIRSNIIKIYWIWRNFFHRGMFRKKLWFWHPFHSLNYGTFACCFVNVTQGRRSRCVCVGGGGASGRPPPFTSYFGWNKSKSCSIWSPPPKNFILFNGTEAIIFFRFLEHKKYRHWQTHFQNHLYLSCSVWVQCKTLC